jgi:predicted nucleic acid-binding protein
MPFVLDSSVALAWVLPDEQSEAADLIAERLEHDFAVVPAVWPLEVLNALLMANRRARIGEDNVQRLLSHLGALPIEIEQIEMTQMLDAISSIARRHNLTSYDAAYIELAKRRAMPIATFDEKLKDACSAERIGVMP